MILPRLNLLLFGIAGTVTLVVVAAVPMPFDREIDRRTGRPVPESVDPLERARASGDARRAIAILAGVDRPDAAIVAAVRELRREVAPLPDPVDDVHALARDGASLDECMTALRSLAGLPGGRSAADRFFATWRGSTASSPDGYASTLLRAGGLGAAQYAMAADRFAAAYRPRSQLLWLLRGFQAHPDSTELASDLIAFYLAAGRLREALAVGVQHARTEPVDADFWRQLASVAAWLSRSEIEAMALEAVVARSEDATARRRLVELYAYVGRPDRGVPHATALAEKAGELAQLEAAAMSALEAGEPDEALAMFDKLSEISADPVRWRLKLVDYALQDLRIDRAIRELEQLVLVGDTVDHTDRLAGLYRRTGRHEALADLLEWRLLDHPDEAGLSELIELRAWTGDVAIAAALGRGDLSVLRPTRFVSRIDRSDLDRAEAVRARANRLVASGNLGDQSVGEVIEELRPYLLRPGFREVAESLLVRFPDDPRAKALRLELLDIGRSPAHSARAAEALATTYPEDHGVVRAWADRAAWAGLLDSEIRARTRLLAFDANDRDNRRSLADLLEARADYGGALLHLRFLAELDGLRSKATTDLIDCLFACDRHGEATEWLTKVAEDPAATTADRLRAAEHLFHRRAFDQAQLLFRRVLDAEPGHAVALLRLGQIHAWTNDPSTAVPYLEQRLAITAVDRDLVEYELGQVYWTLGEDQRARELHLSALPELRARAEPTVETRTMVAMILSRLGRLDQCKPLFRELIAESPRNIDLLLDYGDVLLEERDFEAAREILAHARSLDATYARLLRADARWFGARGDYARAAELLQRTLELHGPEAGVYSELAAALEETGEWDRALDANRRWLSLQNENRAASADARALEDRLATLGLLSFEYREIGDDSILEAFAGGSVLLDTDRTRLNARAGYGRYSGRADAVAAGTVDLREDVGLLDIAVERRFDAHHRFGGGLSFAPGAPGNVPIGIFGSLYLQDTETYRALDLRVYGNELLTEPPAAVALGGRQSGLDVQGYSELGDRLWASTNLRLRLLELDPDGAPPQRDGHFSGELSFGYRFVDGDIAVPDRFRVRRTPAGPLSPFVGDAPERGRDLLLNAWISVQSYRLLDDEDLATSIPIGTQTEYLLGAARLDKHLTPVLGASLEGFIGAELSDGSGIWGLEAGVAWRPEPAVELTLNAGRNDALQRAGGDTDSYFVRLQFYGRW